MNLTLDELKEIEAGEFCPSCGHPFIDHSIEVGCVNCACESNHPRATRLALSDAIQQIERLKGDENARPQQNLPDPA